MWRLCRVKRAFRSRRAISYIMGVVLMVALAVSVTVLAVATGAKWWRGQTQVYQLDTSDSRIYMDEGGNCKLTVVLRNAGTSVLKLVRVAVETKLGSELWITFSAPTVRITDGTEGKLEPSNPQHAYLSGGELIVESGHTASLTFPATGEWKGSQYFEIGKQYMCTVYPSEGGTATSFAISVESTGK